MIKDRSEKELKESAEKVAKTITIRTYVDGSSYDKERKATAKESKIILSIVFGALLSARWNTNLQVSKDTAEFIGGLQLADNVNCYDTIYNKVQKCWDELNG